MTKEASGHWYLQDGSQLLTVPRKKDGEPIKTTLTHAKKRGDLAPGCTTIIKEANARQLNQWLIQQGIMSALTLPRKEDESETAWLARVEHDRQETGKKAAEIGGRIHHALEMYYSGEYGFSDYKEHVAGVVRLLTRRCPGWTFYPEIGVTHSTGFGTKSDIHTDSGGWVIDFKTVETRVKGLPTTTYSSHWLQLAATREAIAESLGRTDLHAAIVYVSRDEPGECTLVEVTPDQLNVGWEAFKCLTLHWQTMNRYAPNWAKRLRIIQETA